MNTPPYDVTDFRSHTPVNLHYLMDRRKCALSVSLIAAFTKFLTKWVLLGKNGDKAIHPGLILNVL